MEGAKTKFEIWTDHKNLEYFMTSQNLNQRWARWALHLSRFEFTLKHIPGNKMGKADGLSRRSDWEKGVEGDNEDRILLKQEWLLATDSYPLSWYQANCSEEVSFRVRKRTR